MKTINKVTLLGYLGADPETRWTVKGAAVSNANLATTRKWKDKQSGEMKEETEWHRLVFFGRLGEIVGEYLRKGAPIYVEGRLQTRKWQDKEGNDRWTTEIVCEDLSMLGNRGDSGGQSPSPSKPAAASSPPENFDDDIPF